VENKKILFDTNAYNHLLDVQKDFAVLSLLECYCTFVQYDELLATPLTSRRGELIALFHKLEPI